MGYDQNNKNIINSKNKLKFNIINDIQKDIITLQLEDILNPKKIETVDSKITNFSILSVEKVKEMQMQLIDKFKIEGFQDFQQYLKINPINIQITYAEIQNELLFYVNRYKYRFIANNLLFSSSIQKDTNVIFITKNGLNKAKEILINEKLFQGIGVIYTSEIKG